MTSVVSQVDCVCLWEGEGIQKKKICARAFCKKREVTGLRVYLNKTVCVKTIDGVERERKKRSLKWMKL